MSSISTSAISDGTLLRSTIDLYRHYGVGVVRKVKSGLAKVEYNPSVFMEPPYRSENKILDLAQAEVCDSPLDRAVRSQWDESWRFELRMLAARLLTGNKGGQLSNARTEILPHQIFTAHRVVSSPRRRFLLADEVGLGKTIEAGMIWQALYQRGHASRTLIVCPAGLTSQWQEELHEKFGATFEIYGRDFTAVNPRIWDLKAQAIASLDTLKRPEHKRILLENRRWDLIIFDEAHRLSAVEDGGGDVRRTQNYRLAEEIRTRQYCDAFLLLTATPHQGDENHSRFINLLNLLDERIDFSALHETTSVDPAAVRFADLVIRTPKKDVTDAHGRTVFKGRQTHRLPFEMYNSEGKFYRAVSAYIRDGYKALERIEEPDRRRAAGFLLTTFQKLNASSTAAIRHALERRLGRLRGQLADACAAEEAHDVEDRLDERFEGEAEEEAVGFNELEILQGEVEILEQVLALRVAKDRKMDELLRLTELIARESPRGVEEKVLIFTEYRQTQRSIVEQLEARHGRGCAVVIHGGMKLERQGETLEDIEGIWQPFADQGAMNAATTKRTTQRVFRDHPKARFLVSTEAGGEGINLQFCHICVNYDMPWNPMRVEQRVGRVYRFGQNKVVQVYHFSNTETIEDQVRSCFEDRVARASEAIAKVTGEDPEEIKASLNGQLESEIDPSRLYTRALVEGDLNRQTEAQIAKAVERARQAYEIATQNLFRDVSSYSFDKYQRELASDLSLDDVRRFVERYLHVHRRQIMQRDGLLEFLVPDPLRKAGLPERFRTVTFDRDEAIRRGDAEFLALGHSFVDAALGHVGSYDFGGLTAVRCIEAPALAGRRGFLFLFVLRSRVAREEGDECLFSFAPVFVRDDGEVDPACVQAAVARQAVEGATMAEVGGDATAAFAFAKTHLERTADVWSWEDDVEFVGVSRCVFR